MAKQEQQEQRTEGRDLARQGSSGAMARGGHPAGMLIAPREFFRMNPFSLYATHERGDGPRDGRVRPEPAATPRPRCGCWAIEVSQNDGKYVVRAELPGLNPADVKLEITDEAVILQGERKVEAHENKSGVHVTERQYGHFRPSRSVAGGRQA